MQIKTKASLQSFVWLIGILLPLIFVIYYFYAQFEKEEELETLQYAANEIFKHISPLDLLHEDNNLLLSKGSFLLSRLLFLPLSRVIKVMKEIETSLEIRKLPLDRKSKDELYQLSETFNRMIERIKTSMRKQRQFISDASHEFKTSLTIIEGYTSLLRRWGFENIDLHREALDAVHAESNRMKQVTYQLLELAELEQESKLSISDFDLVSLCKETIQLLQPLSSKKILLFPSSINLPVEADRLQIKQLLLIILDNALKYANQRIEIHLKSQDSHLWPAVK